MSLVTASNPLMRARFDLCSPILHMEKKLISYWVIFEEDGVAGKEC
jgi:hypothetical protein